MFVYRRSLFYVNVPVTSTSAAGEVLTALAPRLPLMRFPSERKSHSRLTPVHLTTAAFPDIQSGL